MTRRSSTVQPKGKAAPRGRGKKNAGNARRSSRRTAMGVDSNAETKKRRPKSAEGGISDQQQTLDSDAARGSTSQASRSRPQRGK